MRNLIAILVMFAVTVTGQDKAIATSVAKLKKKIQIMENKRKALVDDINVKFYNATDKARKDTIKELAVILKKQLEANQLDAAIATRKIIEDLKKATVNPGEGLLVDGKQMDQVKSDVIVKDVIKDQIAGKSEIDYYYMVVTHSLHAPFKDHTKDVKRSLILAVKGDDLIAYNTDTKYAQPISKMHRDKKTNKMVINWASGYKSEFEAWEEDVSVFVRYEGKGLDTKTYAIYTALNLKLEKDVKNKIVKAFDQ